MTIKPLLDLRQYIEELKKIGEVQDINREVDWNLEMGAITRRAYETGSAAPLFNVVKGIKKGFRALGAPAGLSSKPGQELARVAVSLGLPPATNGRDIIEALAQARTKTPIPPKVVATGPCKENKMLGDDVDLYKFPTPMPHDGDGGRYINTYGLIIARTPDKKWTSWSIARIMIVDKKNDDWDCASTSTRRHGSQGLEGYRKANAVCGGSGRCAGTPLCWRHAFACFRERRRLHGSLPWPSNRNGKMRDC